ncbi:MAG: MATE family efflux transporter [Salinivirgaceae bacterium]|nr:MATE family efflux transporter [Salinivirgaceae bacterium]
MLSRQRLFNLKSLNGLQRRLALLAGPIFMETLLVMTLGAVDTIMLSQHSDNSVAAVGLVNQLISMVFLVFEVTALGTSILCSQYIGAKLRNKVVQTVGVSIVLNTVFGIVVSALFYFCSTGILNLMGVRPELMPDAYCYMRIVGSLAFVQAISMAISASLRAADKAFYPMMVTLVVNILNIIGNYSLIFGKFGMPALGVEGAAISTAISRAIAMVVLFILLKRKHVRHFPRELFKPFPFIELRNLLRIGLPSAGEQISYSLSQVVITFMINFISNEALAAKTYCSNIIMFGFIFSIAMGQGGAICIGHLVGNRKPHAAFVLGKMVMRLAIIVSIILAIVVAIGGRFVFGYLTDNQEIIRMGIIILWIDVVLEFGRAVNIFAVNALRSSGDVYFPVLLSIIVTWGVSVCFSYVFGLWMGYGLIGMWVAFLLDENIRAFIFIHRWNSLKWTSKSFVKDENI